MKLNVPKTLTFGLCSSLIVVDIVLKISKLGIGFWILAVGAIVFALSCMWPDFNKKRNFLESK